MQMTIRTKRLDDRAASYQAACGASHPLREIDSMAQSLRYELGERICEEGRSCEYWHRVVSGAARRLVERPNGGRQTIDILTPGDYFGFFIPDDQGLAIEAAADDTIVLRYPRWCVEFLAEVDAATRRALRDLEIDAISRTRAHLFFGRRMTAAARVSSFLVDMANRLPCDDSGWFELPISVAEIAGYLELSCGTVNWYLMLLAGRRIIARMGDLRIRVLDRDGLKDNEIVLRAPARPTWPLASQRSGHRRRRPASHPAPLDEIGDARR